MITRRQLVCGVVWAAAGLMVRRRVFAGPVATDSIGDQVQTLQKGQLPDFATHAPDVQRLYRYAVEDDDLLRYIPCFCGCARFGHRSNRDCYVKSLHDDGSISFTSHAAT